MIRRVRGVKKAHCSEEIEFKLTPKKKKAARVLECPDEKYSVPCSSVNQ